MHACRSGPEHCAFGMDCRIAGFNAANAANTFSLVRAPSIELQRLRQDRDAARGRHESRVRLRALIAAEEEEPVLSDRTADGETAFIPARLRLVDAILLVEEIVGVEISRAGS